MGLTHQEPSFDLTDADLVSAFLAMFERTRGSESGSFVVDRFSSDPRMGNFSPAHSIHATEKDLRSELFGFESIDIGSLRTITKCSLTPRPSPHLPANEISITFTRDPRPVLQFDAPDSRSSGNLLTLLVVAQEEGLIAPRVVRHTADAEEVLGTTGEGSRALAEQIAVLRDLVNKQAKANERVRERLEEDYRYRLESLRDEYEKRSTTVRGECEAWAEDLRKRTKEKEQELEGRAAELAEREARIDLQTERDARRNLRTQIQAAAKDMFEKPDLSEQAKANFERVANACRWTIGGSVVLLAIAFFGPPILELWLDKVLSSETTWLVWSMRILAGVTLAATLIYYVSSLAAWSRQVSTIELRSRQFALDVDRASWLVEMTLEYEKEGKTLPPAMVESFTRGLFDGGSQSAPHEQPSASLLHLIQNAESLKVGAAGAELTLTGRQIRKADALAAKDA